MSPPANGVICLSFSGWEEGPKRCRAPSVPSMTHNQDHSFLTFSSPQKEELIKPLGNIHALPCSVSGQTWYGKLFLFGMLSFYLP